MTHVRTWMLLGAGAVLVASGSAAGQNPTTSGIPIRKERDTTRTTTTTTTVRTDTTAPMSRRMMLPFDVSAYANATEPNIIAHLASGDSLEVQIAQLAQTKATDQRVKDYATMLANDHTAHLGKVLHVMTDKNIGSQPLVNDPEGARSVALLNSLTAMTAGSQWDAMFLRAQIRHHQNEIDALTAIRPLVKTEDLRDVVDATLPALTKHRDTGRSVATTLGIPVR